MIKSLLFIMKTFGQILTPIHTPKVPQIELKNIFVKGQTVSYQMHLSCF